MSVALATMESAYGLRLGLVGHHHHHRHHHPLHHHHRHPNHLHHNYHDHHQLSRSLRSPSPGMSIDGHIVVDSPSSRTIRHRECDDDSATLRFSVDNILRPDFGRDAILSTRTSVKRPCQSPIRPSAKLPRHSPLPVARDLSLASIATTRLVSPQSSSTTTTQVYTTSSHHHSRQDRDNFDTTSPALTRHSSGLSRSGSLESLASSRSSVTGCSINGSTSLSSAASTIGCAESISGDSVASSTTSGTSSGQQNGQSSWPAWVYCTRYSDRPSSGPRTRRVKRTSTGEKSSTPEEKRPRTAFSGEQLARLKTEFVENRYLTERRRQQLSRDLGLNEAQIKIWFQNKRAKIKKATGQKNPLALQLMAQGLYNHSTIPVDEDGEEIADPESRSSV